MIDLAETYSPIEVEHTRLFQDVFLGQVQIVQGLLQRVENVDQMIGVRYGASVVISTDLIFLQKRGLGFESWAKESRRILCLGWSSKLQDSWLKLESQSYMLEQ